MMPQEFRSPFSDCPKTSIEFQPELKRRKDKIKLRRMQDIGARTNQNLNMNEKNLR